MNLSKRSGNGIYAFKFTNPITGKPQRVSTGTRNRSEAEAWVQTYCASNAITSSTQYRHTLSESLWDTYRRIWSKQKAHKSTFAKITLVDRKIGSMLLYQVTYESLSRWFDEEVRTGRKDVTVGRDINVISKTLHEAWRLGWINAVPPMPSCPTAQTTDRYITYEEEAKLIEVAESLKPRRLMDTMVHAIPVLCDTGMRLGELMQITKRNIRMSGKQPILHLPKEITKTEKSRTIPLTTKAHGSLMAIFNDPEWTSRKPRNSHMSQQFRMIADVADMPDVHLHILRHTCASRLVQAGEDLYRVKTWLGHSDVKVTERYAHLKPEHLMSSVAFLER